MKNVTKILFSILLVLLVFPAIQQFSNIFKLKPLSGVIVEQGLPEFSKLAWFEGSYQQKMNSFIDQHYGFRPFFIRIFNQIDYTFFNEAHGAGIIVGKDKYLFESWYIWAYHGDRFIGEKKIKENVRKLSAIQLKLKELDTEMIIVLAPGKGHFYPEYIPDYMKKPIKETNNEYYEKVLEESDLTVLDASSWFLSMKDTAQYPLFPKTGTHWSDYASVLVSDTLLTVVEDKLGYNMPRFIWESNELTTEARNDDDDLEESMNLFFRIPQIMHAYPVVRRDDDTTANQNKPSAISIADSFFWQLFNGPFAWSFSDIKYWYYFSSIYPDTYKAPTTTKDIDLIEELAKRDVVIVLASTANLTDMGFGFIDEAYKAFYPEHEDELKSSVEKFIKRIRNNESMMDMVKEKALKKNISIDSMVVLDATYLAKKEYEKAADTLSQ